MIKHIIFDWDGTLVNTVRFLKISFENIREMMDMVQMMKELFPEGMGTQGADGFGGGMDMTQLFSMFGGNDMSGIF